VPPPQPKDLDYALLRLTTQAPNRGYLKLSDSPPSAAGDPLIIVQHPDGEPLRFAIDTTSVIGLVHDGLRLRYSTNTAPGSSGSPCFSMDWDLLALHHLGDPKSGLATFNQGVPVGLIRKSIEADGASQWLGG
jgi:V8-like Glu-specific endopeptidase